MFPIGLCWSVACQLAVAYVVLTLCRWVYRISPLHPLARYPTPSRLACISQWYEFYWNFIRGGRLLFKIEKWHEELGPIIRIGSNELHINDGPFYNICYAPNYRFLNYRPHYNIVGSLDIILGMVDPTAHKKRRATLNRLFSRPQVQKLEKNIRSHISNLAAIISTKAKENRRTGEGTCISKLLRYLVIDIVSEYAFSEGFCTLQGDLDVEHPFILAMRRTVPNMWFLRFLWPLNDLFTALPHWVARPLAPSSLRGQVDMKQVMSEQVDELIQDPTKARAKATHMTIFQALMEGGGSGSSVPLSRDILIGEGLTIVGAALETTSWILTSAVHQLCLNPLIQRRLHDELVRAFPRGGRDDIYEIELATCEKLPYLTAVIKETHRLTPGIPGRLPRVVPEGGITCGGSHIPGATVVSMSIYLMHHNQAVYFNPKTFEPDRWLGMTADSLEEKYLVPFGKGSRSCLGMYLASAEIYITLAVLFRRFKFALHKDNEMTGAWVDHFMTTPDGQAALVVSAAEYDD